jgi:Flp pilus assembly protein TadD
MRFLRFLPFLLILPAASVPLGLVSSDQPVRLSPKMADEARAGELETLFQNLRYSENVDEAAKAEAEIFIRLTVSKLATTNLLMESASVALSNDDTTKARAILDDVVSLDPRFAEGLTRAASLAYQDGDYARAQLLLVRAVRIEPRHFAAWAGLGAVYEDTGKLSEAEHAYREALYWHPFLDAAKRGLMRIEAKTTGLSL